MSARSVPISSRGRTREALKNVYARRGRFVPAGDQVFVAIQSGVCELQVADGTRQTLHPGDIVVLPRGDSHVLRSVPSAEEQNCTLLCGASVVRESEHPAGSQVVMARLSDALVLPPR
jgi:hypothetical protein